MNNEIINFLQAIQTSSTIPDVSPVFENPFELLDGFGYEYKGFVNADPDAKRNLFERWVGNVEQQLVVYYDIETDYAYVDYTVFHQQGMNITHILHYNENRMISSKAIIPKGAANYCQFNYFYTYENDQLKELFFRHDPRHKALPEINIAKIIIHDNMIAHIEFVYFGVDDKPLSISRYSSTHKIYFSHNTFKSIVDMDISHHTIETLLSQFPLAITKEQETVILMSTI